MWLKYLQDVADKNKGLIEQEDDIELAKFRIGRGYCERTDERPAPATEKPKNKTVKKTKVSRKAANGS